MPEVEVRAHAFRRMAASCQSASFAAAEVRAGGQLLARRRQLPMLEVDLHSHCLVRHVRRASALR